MKIEGMFRNEIVKILIWTNTYARTGKCDLEFIKETLPKEIILIKSWICVKMCCRCQSRNDVCCVHQTTNKVLNMWALRVKKEGGDFEQSWELRTRVNQTGFFDV